MKTVIRTLILFFGLILLYAPLHAQTAKIDSLQSVLATQKQDTNRIRILLALGWSYISKSPDTAIQYGHKALSLAKKLNAENKIINAYYLFGYTYYDLNKDYETNQKALEYFLILQKLIEKGDNDPDKLGYIHRELGIIYLRANKLPEALSHEYKALSLFQKAGKKTLEGELLYWIGKTYIDQGDYKEALKNLLESLKIRRDEKYKPTIVESLIAIATVYQNLGNHTLALRNSLEALNLTKESDFKGPDWMLPVTYRTLGTIYDNEGDKAKLKGNKQKAITNYQLALNSFLTALAFWKKPHNLDGIVYISLMAGNLNRKLDRLEKAEQLLTRALKGAFVLKYKDHLMQAYRFLSQLDSTKGNYQLAYQHYKSHIMYRDSIFNQANTQKLTEVKMQYAFDKKEALANAEQEKKELQRQRDKNKQVFIVISLLILVLMASLLAYVQWRNNQQKQRTNALLQTQKNEIEQTLHQLKNTQTQLIHKEKMASLGELTAGIAHEIQNPLNFVTNFSELSTELVDELEEEQQKPTPDATLEIELLTDLKDNLNKIHHHGHRASSIVKGMLEHARRSSGERTPTDLNKLIDEYLRLAYHGLRAKDKNFNAELVTQFDQSVGEVVVMPQEIGRVLLNLFSNAFYAVRQQQQTSPDDYHPLVKVCTQREANQVVVTVQDNGVGMTDAVKAKIFQPFFTTKPTGEGTGLGLSLSYDIITKGHGGNMAVTSQPGQGAEFVISLPSEPTVG